MERCPACRARLGAETLCPRCGCDCTLPLRAEHQARGHLLRAIRELAAGRRSEAEACARQALMLKNDSLAHAVAAWIGAASRQAN